MLMQPVVSTLIVTHNSAAQIGACLNSLARHTRISHEIILVDNASDDNTPAQVVTRGLSVRLLENIQNTGFAGSSRVRAQARDH